MSEIKTETNQPHQPIKKSGLSSEAVKSLEESITKALDQSYIPPEDPYLTAVNKLAQEISETEKRAIDAEQNSLIDPLTGCYNEKYLEKFIKENFNPRRDHHRLGLVYVDVNNLKKTNDTLGHQAGDELIKQSANYLKKTFRTEDVVVHLHGDEFVVICSNYENDPNFLENLPRVVKDRTTSKPPEDFIYLDKKVNYSVATGVAIYDQDRDSGNLLQTLNRADLLMQANKVKMKTGR